MGNENIDSEWTKIKEKYNVGDIINGQILFIRPYGLFIDIGEENVLGFVRVVNLSDEFVKYDPRNFKTGEKIKGVIVEFTDHNNQVCLSLKNSDFKKFISS